MAMKSLIAGLKADFAEYDRAIAKAYACTCKWEDGQDEHAQNCPKELRLRDVEASRASSENA